MSLATHIARKASDLSLLSRIASLLDCGSNESFGLRTRLSKARIEEFSSTHCRAQSALICFFFNRRFYLIAHFIHLCRVVDVLCISCVSALLRISATLTK